MEKKTMTKDEVKAALVNLQYPTTSEKVKTHVTSPSQTTISQEHKDWFDSSLSNDKEFKDEDSILLDLGVRDDDEV